MGFLYKHYEKIILAFFLLVFVSALVYLIMVFSQSKEISEDDLKIKPEGTNYASLFDENKNEIKGAGEKGNFSALAQLKEEKKWVHSKKRDTNSLVSTDLLIPFKAARCDKCKKLIPCVAFKMKKCPLCGKDPGEVHDVKNIRITDVDKDGIPDKLEAQVGLNPSNPNDKWLDLDSDGFLNFTEYEEHTAINDPKSHPPLAWRLKLLGLVRKKLPLQLVDVKERGSSKEEWVIEMKVLNRRNKWTTAFKKIGDTLKLDKQGRYVYTITDAVHKTGEKFDKKLNRPVPVSASEITLQNVLDKNDKPILVVVGQPAHENKIKLGFQDTFSGKKYILKNGATFTVGDTTVGTEEYTISEVSDIIKVPRSESWAKIKRKDGEIFKILFDQSKCDNIKTDALGDSAPSRKNQDNRYPLDPSIRGRSFSLPSSSGSLRPPAKNTGAFDL